MKANKKALTILFGITFLGLLLRLWGAGHGLGDELFTHPDEIPFAYNVEEFSHGHFSSPLWFFSPLWTYLNTLGVYLYSFLEGILKYPFGVRHSFIEIPDTFRIVLIGRVIGGVLGGMTIPVVYLIGKKLFNEKIGLLSAGTMAVLYLHVVQSHFAYVDVPQTFFLSLSFYFMARVSLGEGEWNSFLAGVFLALSIATKISAAPGFVSLIFAHYLREKSTTHGGIKGLVRSKYLYISISGLILGYGLCTPWYIVKPIFFIKSIGGILNLLYSGLSPATRYGQPFDILRGANNLLKIIFKEVGLHFFLLSLLILAIIAIKKQWKVFFLLSFPLAYLPFFILATWHDPKEVVPVLPFLVIFIAYGLSSMVDILPLRRKGAVMFVISMFFIIPILWNDIKADYFFWQKDTRVLAADWIKENLPWDAKIGVEGYRLYNIPIYHERYQINQEFSGLPFEESRKEVDFVVISSIIYDNSSPERKLYYDSLRENAQLIKVFKTFSWYFFNPKIEIYRLSRQGGFTTPIIPRTYSEGGSFDISSGEGAYGKESLSFWIGSESKVKRIIVSEKKLDTIGIFFYNGRERTELKIRNVLKGEKVILDPYERRFIIVNPSLSFPYINYIYNISVSSGKGEGAFVSILTDPKRIANAIIESGEWEQAISIFSKNSPLDQEGWSLLGLAYSMGNRNKEALEAFRKGLTPSAGEVLDSNKWMKTFEKFTNIDSVFLADSLSVNYGIDQFYQQSGRKMGWIAHFDPQIDMPGFLLFGPYKRLPIGNFKAQFRIRVLGSGRGQAARIDVFNGEEILAEKVIKDTKGVFEEFLLSFYNEDPDRALEFRVEAFGGRELWVEDIKVFPDIQGHYKRFLSIIHHYWGISALEAGFHKEAIEHFRIADALDYKETDGFYRMAKTYEKRGLKEESVKAYKKVILEVPNHIDSLLALRRLMSQRDEGLEERIKILTPQYESQQIFGDSIEFLGYRLDKEEVHPGDELNISYFWRSLKKMRTNYSIFVHFQRDGAMVFQNDHSPSVPMKRWKEGGVMREDYTVKIPSDAPSGKYDIIIGVWDPEGLKERIKLKGQTIDEIRIGSIEVSAKPEEYL